MTTPKHAVSARRSPRLTPLKERDPVRNAAIRKAFAAAEQTGGISLNQLGSQYHLTAARVHQIVHGRPTVSRERDHTSRCADCTYYDSHGPESGQCRRRAPIPRDFLVFRELEIMVEIALAIRDAAQLRKSPARALVEEPAEALDDALWPGVAPDDWCGEWEGVT